MSVLTSDMGVLIALLAVTCFSIAFFSLEAGIVLLVLSMLFSPEIALSKLSVRSITVRFEDVLIPVLALGLAAHFAAHRERKLLVRSPLNAPIFWLIGCSLLSTLWGAMTGWVDLVPAFFYILKTCEFFMIFFLVAAYIRTETQVRIFLFFVILTVAGLALYTLYQVPHVQMFTEHRITAPFEGETPEPSTVGGYMAFLFLIILCMFLYAKKLWMRALYGILMILVLIPFLYTLNRTSYAALLSGLVFVCLAEKRKKLRFVLIVLLLTSPWWLPPSVKARIAYTWEDAANPGRELGVDHSFQERIYAFRKLWSTWKYSPVIGWGVTSMYIIDNQYCRTLHEIGIVGMAMWIWIFVRLFRMSGWLFRTLEGGSLKGLALGYQAGLLGLLFHAFGATTFYIVRIMEPFLFVSGLIVGLYLIRVREASLARIPVWEGGLPSVPEALGLGSENAS